jgi:hypothetical protein
MGTLKERARRLKNARNIAEAIVRKKVEQKKCICPKECDCENPEPKNGVALVSNCCPIHSDPPQIEINCPASKHRNGAVAWVY